MSLRNPFPEVESLVCPFTINRKAISGLERARSSMYKPILAPSVIALLRNFCLAGVLKKRSLTIMVVPSGAPISSSAISSPPSIQYRLPERESAVFVMSSTLDTAAMLERASPRNPRDAIESRSQASLILLVA